MMVSGSVTHWLHVASISFEIQMCLKRRQNEGRIKGSLGLIVSLKAEIWIFLVTSSGSQCLVGSTDGRGQVHSLERKGFQIPEHGPQSLQCDERLRSGRLEIKSGRQLAATACQCSHSPWLALSIFLKHTSNCGFALWMWVQIPF